MRPLSSQICIQADLLRHACSTFLLMTQLVLTEAAPLCSILTGRQQAYCSSSARLQIPILALVKCNRQIKKDTNFNLPGGFIDRKSYFAHDTYQQELWIDLSLVLGCDLRVCVRCRWQVTTAGSSERRGSGRQKLATLSAAWSAC